MSPQLIKYIESLPISVFLLSSDRQVIGRKVGEDLLFYYINALCSLETDFNDDNTFRQFMIPLVPHSLSETSSLSRSHVMCESPASLLLKKSYCQTLLAAKVKGLNSSSSIDLDTTDQDSGPENPYGDRWNY